jgi:hypothetical protein
MGEEKGHPILPRVKNDTTSLVAVAKQLSMEWNASRHVMVTTTRELSGCAARHQLPVKVLPVVDNTHHMEHTQALVLYPCPCL